MNKMLRTIGLLIGLLVVPVARGAGIPTGAEDSFNRMNSISAKYQLGTLIKEALGSAAGVNLTDGKIFLGDNTNTAQQVTLSGDVTVGDTGVTAIGAGKVTVAQLSSAAFTEVTGTLTQANLTACHTGAINLLPAPGAGKVIVVDGVEFFHSYSTAAYTGGGDLVMQYTGSTAILDSDVSLVTQAASASWFSKPSTYDLDGSTGTAKGGMQVDGLANLGVEVLCAVANFGAGNVANVLKWRIRYHVVTLLT